MVILSKSYDIHEILINASIQEPGYISQGCKRIYFSLNDKFQ